MTSRPPGAAQRVSARELKRLGALLLGATVLLAATGGYVQRTFDSYVHLFFASHYRNTWFTLWEPRWYGGFSTTTYPPLVHQLLALLSIPLGYERAFAVLTAIVVTALAYCTALFAARMVPQAQRNEVFAWAFVLAALSPTIPRFAYVYGQLPTLTATPLVLTALLALDAYLRKGSTWALLTYTAFIGAVGGAHHMTLIFAALGSAMVGLRAIAEDKSRIARTALAGICAVVAIASVIWPFIKYATAAAQAEIPHVSRKAIWQRSFDIEVLELGVLLLFVPMYALKTRREWIFLAGLALLVALSAGGTTPLPEILFRGQARWLTYDKFHVWASAFAIVAVAIYWRSPKAHTVFAALCVLVPLNVWSVSHKDASKLQPPFVKDITGPLAILNQAGAEKYRHLSLGFGDQSCRFDIFGKSPNIDGDYHTARNHPLLRESGMSTLDTAKYYDAGPRVLKAILADADAQNLRWVLVFDDWYYSFLFDAGYELKEVFETGVSVFERDVPPIAEVAHTQESAAASIVWGVLPLSYLSIGLLLLWLRRMRLHTSA